MAKNNLLEQLMRRHNQTDPDKMQVCRLMALSADGKKASYPLQQFSVLFDARSDQYYIVDNHRPLRGWVFPWRLNHYDHPAVVVEGRHLRSKFQVMTESSYTPFEQSRRREYPFLVGLAAPFLGPMVSTFLSFLVGSTVPQNIIVHDWWTGGLVTLVIFYVYAVLITVFAICSWVIARYRFHRTGLVVSKKVVVASSELYHHWLRCAAFGYGGMFFGWFLGVGLPLFLRKYTANSDESPLAFLVAFTGLMVLLEAIILSNALSESVLHKKSKRPKRFLKQKKVQVK